jgi:uncharacterized membrane protein YdjX (TVP38/TMEM64 family)
MISSWLKGLGLKQGIYILVGAAILIALFSYARELPVNEFVGAIRDLGMLPFFVAMAILPVIGFPVTPFYLLAGATFGIWISLVGTALSQALNLVLAYWLARRYLSGLIKKLVKKAHYKVPTVPPKHFVNFTILVKITPGPPNFLKSFILGLARIPFWIFFIVSWPTTMGYAVGVIIFGDSLMDGDVSQAILGFSFMIVFLIGVKLAAGYYNKRRGMGGPVAGLDSHD